MQKLVSAKDKIASDPFCPACRGKGATIQPSSPGLCIRAFKGRTTKLAFAILLSLLISHAKPPPSVPSIGTATQMEADRPRICALSAHRR